MASSKKNGTTTIITTAAQEVVEDKVMAKVDLFCMYYVTCNWNGTEAAKRAGYAKAGAKSEAVRLLKKPEVRAKIIAHAQKLMEGIEIEGKKVIAEVAQMAFMPLMEDGPVNGAVKLRALEMLGTYLKLWEGSSGNRIINIQMNQLDLRTM